MMICNNCHNKGKVQGYDGHTFNFDIYSNKKGLLYHTKATEEMKNKGK
jgi:hypothetical protein